MVIGKNNYLTWEYDDENDILYIKFNRRIKDYNVSEFHEPGIVFDFNKKRELIGMEILDYLK